MKLAFIFTNYNNSFHTENAIKSLEFIHGEIKNDIVVVIIDNNSNDEDVNKIRKLEKKYIFVDVIYNQENIGYFPGLNCGIKLLKEKYSEFQHAIIGNNDLIFGKEFYKTLLHSHEVFLKYPVISPDITTLDNNHQNPHVINKISKVREFVYDIYYSNYYFAQLILKFANRTKKYTSRDDEEQYFKAQEIYQGYGACYILTPLFFKHFEELWAPTFLMYEEFFLSKQLADKGFKIYYEPSIHITHAAHSSTGKLPRKKMWEIARNAHREYRKYVKIF